MDSAEAHEHLSRATGAAQPYTPPLETEPTPESVQPAGLLKIPGELSPEHEAAMLALTQGAQGPQLVRLMPDEAPMLIGTMEARPAMVPLVPAANAVARSFGEAMASIGDFLECASELLDQLDVVEDDDGRAIWLTAEEVELDQWLGRLVAARDAMRDRLAPRSES